MLNKKDFSKLALKLAFPIMVQNLISTLVNTADTIMLGYVSQTAMSATSLANQFTFIIFCFFYGITAGTSVLVAQYWGRKDEKTIEKIIAIAIKISIVISIIFFAISFFAPQTIMKFFSNSPDTIAQGARYLKIISFSYIFMGFTQVYMSALRSVEKVVIPSVTYVISFCTNVFFNAVFIFGLFGAPKLGLVGVALGTVIARVVEAVICIGYSVFASNVKVRIKYMFAKNGELVMDFLKISVPSSVGDLSWSIATSVFAAILGHIGDDIVAANAVAVMIVNLGAIAVRGFANASTIVVSNALGQNKIEMAKVYSKRMLYLTTAISFLGCAVILIARPFVVSYYQDKLTPTAVYYLGVIMIMTTWRLVGEAVNLTLICGCFRAGGDAKFGMYLDIFFMWVIAVPIMALAAYAFKLPPLLVYFFMTMDEFYKFPVVLTHFFKFKWMKNITRDL